MRSLPESSLADDDGSTDLQVAEALAAYDDGGRTGPVMAALAGSRVLVPVVAVATDLETGAAAVVREKTADIAAVLLQGRDGRRALLAFTGMVALQRWRADARPVPLVSAAAARAALDEGADALLIDVAGPVPYAVERPDLEHLAAGHRLVRTVAGYAWLEAGPVDG